MLIDNLDDLQYRTGLIGNYAIESNNNVNMSVFSEVLLKMSKCKFFERFLSFNQYIGSKVWNFFVISLIPQICIFAYMLCNVPQSKFLRYLPLEFIFIYLLVFSGTIFVKFCTWILIILHTSQALHIFVTGRNLIPTTLLNLANASDLGLKTLALIIFTFVFYINALGNR